LIAGGARAVLFHDAILGNAGTDERLTQHLALGPQVDVGVHDAPRGNHQPRADRAEHTRAFERPENRVGAGHGHNDAGLAIRVSPSAEDDDDVGAPGILSCVNRTETAADAGDEQLRPRARGQQPVSEEQSIEEPPRAGARRAQADPEPGGAEGRNDDERRARTHLALEEIDEGGHDGSGKTLVLPTGDKKIRRRDLFGKRLLTS